MYHKDIGSCEMYRHKTNARVQIPEGEKFMNERNVRPFSKRDEIGYVFSVPVLPDFLTGEEIGRAHV